MRNRYAHAGRRPSSVALSLALLLLLASVAPTSASPGWSFVGSGPMATSTAKTVAVRYPVGLASGDLLLLSCQGRRNSMQWSAPGYATLTGYDDQWPQGPPGIQFELLWRWSTGTEGASVTVTNTTGVNGWSCVLSAFRGGIGSGPWWGTQQASAGGVIYPQRTRTMIFGAHTPPEGPICEPWVVNCPDYAGYLWVYWFTSADDNNHGNRSEGSLGFGGPAYDTTVGVDHATSMVYHFDYLPGPPHYLTMRQRSNGPDSWTSFGVGFPPTP
jgi:hypothetical protein